MSEDSTDRTKREMIDLYQNYEWSYQYSIFYDNPANSIHLQEDLNNLRVKLKNRNQPFYIIKRTHYKRGLQAFATVFTTQTIKSFDQLVRKSTQHDINILYQEIDDLLLISTIRALKTERLHNLDKFFKLKSVKRYSVLNKNKLVKRVISLTI